MSVFKKFREPELMARKPDGGVDEQRTRKPFWIKYAATTSATVTFLLFGANGLVLHYLNPVPDEADLITLTGVVKQVNARIPHVELVLSDGSVKGIEFPGSLILGGDPGRYQNLPQEKRGLKVKMEAGCEAIVKGRPMRGA